MTVEKPKLPKAAPKTTGSGSVKVAGTEFVKISCTQTWGDLLSTGVKKEKIDQQPNDMLWRQLLVDSVSRSCQLKAVPLDQTT